jgi:hypothetical protein
MKHFALAILLVAAACSGKGKKDTTGSGSGSGGPPLAKKIVVTWGIQQQTAAAELFLQTTDETGKQVSHPLGKVDGTCETVTPAEDMKALSGVRCMAGSTGTELHAVWNSGEIIILKMRVDAGVTPDPMAREELTRIDVPNGAAVEAGA